MSFWLERRDVKELRRVGWDLDITSFNRNILAENNLKANETLNKLHIVKEQDNHSVENSSFKDIVNNELEKLNNQRLQADKLTEDFISGSVDDLHTVLIATDEARLSLELAVQVRNKLVEAYKEINNMQL